jgi:N-acetyl-anhydromuramyl-L-alanine amidase AmpD
MPGTDSESQSSSPADQVNTRRMIRVVATLAVAMTVGLTLCWTLMPSNPPKADRVITPKGMAEARRWQAIVIACTGGDGGSFEEIMRQGPSAHFIIGNGHGAADGEAISTPLWTAQQRTIGREPEGRSARGIDIVLAGDFSRRPPTDAQMKTLVHLVYNLTTRHRIPLTNIRGQWELDGRPDEGQAFPMTEFLRRLGEKHRK